jgi:hypothetical protein
VGAVAGGGVGVGAVVGDGVDGAEEADHDLPGGFDEGVRGGVGGWGREFGEGGVGVVPQVGEGVVGVVGDAGEGECQSEWLKQPRIGLFVAGGGAQCPAGRDVGVDGKEDAESALAVAREGREVTQRAPGGVCPRQGGEGDEGVEFFAEFAGAGGEGGGVAGVVEGVAQLVGVVVGGGE